MSGMTSVVVVQSLAKVITNNTVLTIVEEAVSNWGDLSFYGLEMDRGLPLWARGPRSASRGGLPKLRGRTLGLLDYNAL